MSNGVHPPHCDCDAYACTLRAKGVQISAAATPTSHNRQSGDNARFNQWEKGIASEPRAGGTRMPYLDRHGSTIGLKKFSEMSAERSSLDTRRTLAAQNAGATHG